MIFNTHLDNKGKEARLQGARLCKRWLGEHAKGMAVIFMGDLNCHEEDPPVKALLEADGLALSDAYREVHLERREDEGTLNHFLGRKLGSRIDFILHTGELRAVAAGIERTAKGGRYPSDHYPVSVRLEWR